MVTATGLKLESKAIPAFTLRNRPQDLDFSVLGALERLEKGGLSDMVVTGDKGIFVLAVDKQAPDLTDKNPRFNESRDQIASFAKLYKDRRDAALDALEKYFPKGATWTKPGGGFYIWVTLPPEIDTNALVPKAIAAKVAYVPGTAFYADGFGSWSLRISYCHPTPERITDGIKSLAAVIKTEMESRQIN